MQRRSCAARGARAAVRASATRRDVEGVAPKIAAAAAVASTMLAASPAMAATHEVAQVAAAEFMPTVLVSCAFFESSRSALSSARARI